MRRVVQIHFPLTLNKEMVAPSLVLAKQACNMRTVTVPRRLYPHHVVLWNAKNPNRMGSGLEQEDGFLLFHVERLESVPCIKHSLGMGFEPPTSHR